MRIDWRKERAEQLARLRAVIHSRQVMMATHRVIVAEVVRNGWIMGSTKGTEWKVEYGWVVRRV